MRRVVKAAPALCVGTLTLFAFSGDNWQRPASEVVALLDLVESYLLGEAGNCAASGVRIRVIGRRDRIPPSLKAAIEAAEAATSHGRTLGAAYRRRLFEPRCDLARRVLDAFEPRSLASGIRAQARRGNARRTRHRRCRFADSHRRRAPPERFSAVGMRVRGVGLHFRKCGLNFRPKISKQRSGNSPHASGASANCRRQWRATKLRALRNTVGEKAART